MRSIGSQLPFAHSLAPVLKLSGIGHILPGIFIALGAIVRALALMPHRLSYAMERTS